MGMKDIYSSVSANVLGDPVTREHPRLRTLFRRLSSMKDTRTSICALKDDLADSPVVHWLGMRQGRRIPHSNPFALPRNSYPYRRISRFSSRVTACMSYSTCM